MNDMALGLQFVGNYIFHLQSYIMSILDDSLGIDWRIPTDKAILSEKDTKLPLLKDFDSPFDINVSLY